MNAGILVVLAGLAGGKPFGIRPRPCLGNPGIASPRNHLREGDLAMTGNERHTQCEVVHDDLAELALGILTGRERSVVLSHLARCTDCQTKVDRLSRVCDAILILAPEIEPTSGFEIRTVEKMGVSRPGWLHFARLGGARRRRGGHDAPATLVIRRRDRSQRIRRSTST